MLARIFFLACSPPRQWSFFTVIDVVLQAWELVPQLYYPRFYFIFPVFFFFLVFFFSLPSSSFLTQPRNIPQFHKCLPPVIPVEASITTDMSHPRCYLSLKCLLSDGSLLPLLQTFLCCPPEVPPFGFFFPAAGTQGNKCVSRFFLGQGFFPSFFALLTPSFLRIDLMILSPAPGQSVVVVDALPPPPNRGAPEHQDPPLPLLPSRFELS